MNDTFYCYYHLSQNLGIDWVFAYLFMNLLGKEPI